MKKDNLIFRLENQQLPDYEECNNWLGFNQIEILQFNYDGNGNALILEDGDISYMSPKILSFMFFGGWYSLIKD
jgi:hypothetical protein